MQMFEPADNIDLLAVVQEWEEYYEMRFARKPKLARIAAARLACASAAGGQWRGGRGWPGREAAERCEEPHEVGAPREAGELSRGGS